MLHLHDGITPRLSVQCEGIWFPAYDIDAFIAYDLKFDNPQREYPTSSDIAPPHDCRLFMLLDVYRRRIWAVYMPTAINEDYGSVDDWDVLVFRRKSRAQAAANDNKPTITYCCEDCA